jgi:hypothetical protein
VKLFDPDGIEVAPAELRMEPYRLMNARYIADTGQWQYDENFNLVSGEYYLGAALLRYQQSLLIQVN